MSTTSEPVMKVWPSGNFKWEAEKTNDATIRVLRMDWDTVSVHVASRNQYMGYELTPDKAREMAAALILGAETVDKYLAENALVTDERTKK